MDVIVVILTLVAVAAGAIGLFRSQGQEPLAWGVLCLGLIHLLSIVL